MYEMMVRFFHIYSHFCFVVVFFYVLAVPPSFLAVLHTLISRHGYHFLFLPSLADFYLSISSPLSSSSAFTPFPFLSLTSLLLPVPPFAHHLYHLYLLKSPTSPFLPISDYRPLITNSPSFLLLKTDRSPSLLRRKRQCDVPTDPQRPALIP